MTRLMLATGVTGMIIAVAACGSSAGRSVGERNCGSSEVGGLGDTLTMYRTWLEAPPSTEAREAEAEDDHDFAARSVRFERVRHIKGGPGPTELDVRVSTHVYAAWRGEDSDATSLLLGASPLGRRPQDLAAHVVVAVDADGNVTFLGACTERMQSIFDRFVGHQKNAGDIRTPADQLRGVVAGGADTRALYAFESSAPPDWTTIPPAIRQLRLAPASVRATLSTRTLNPVDLGAWKGFAVTVCSRIDLGWNDCVSPEAFGDHEVHVRPGQSFEVWVLGANPELANPIGRGATFTWPVSADTFSFRPAPEIRTRADLDVALRAGRPVFVAA